MRSIICQVSSSLRYLAQSIPSLRILARRVCGLIFSNAAVPRRPSMRPRVTTNTLSMCFFIAASSDSTSDDAAGAAGDDWLRPAAAGRSLAPRAPATSSRFPLPKIAARSITAPSSRTLPGQAYEVSKSDVFDRQRGLGQHEPHRRPFGKVPCQRGNILRPLAQRRQADGKDCDAIPEIFAESPFGHHRRQVAMGGGHDANVDVHRFVPAHALHPAVLEDSQQANLYGQRQLASLVQQEGAAIGPLEPSLPRLHRAGEGPFLMTEKLRVDQLRRDRTAIHAEERSIGPRRLRVDHPGDEFLAGARFAEDEYGGVVPRHQGDPFDDELQAPSSRPR